MKNLLLIFALFVGAAFIGDASAAEPVKKLTKLERAAKEKKRIAEYAKNGIPFREYFNSRSITRLIKNIDEVAKLKKKGEYINILLDSGGGAVFAGIRLIHSIQKHQFKGLKFRGVVENFCASMCFVTLQALDERVSYPFALIMDHRASGGAEHVLQEISDIFEDMTYRRLKINKELYIMAVWSEVWLGHKKSIPFGLLDRMILPGQSFELPVKKVK